MDASLKSQLNAFRNKQVTTSSIPQYPSRPKQTPLTLSKGSAFVRNVKPTKAPEDAQIFAQRNKLLKDIVTFLRKRHREGETHALSLDEIGEQMNADSKQPITHQQEAWLLERLPINSKIETVTETATAGQKGKFEGEQILKYKFKPKYQIKDRKTLLKKLKEHHESQLGGINFEDVEESMDKANRAVQKLEKENRIYDIETREGNKKQRILFYQDHRIDMEFDEVLRQRWREVSIQDKSDDQIRKFLNQHDIVTTKNVGQAIVPQKKRKKAKVTNKVPRARKTNNAHVEGLEDYTNK